MSKAHGYHHGTRNIYRKKKRGEINLTSNNHVYQIGDYATIIGNSVYQKGLPFKYYHGRTGKIFDIRRRSVGMTINKRVQGNIVTKLLYVRNEHLKPSRCREDYLKRKENLEKKIEAAKKDGKELTFEDVKLKDYEFRGERTIDLSKMKVLDLEAKNYEDKYLRKCCVVHLAKRETN